MRRIVAVLVLVTLAPFVGCATGTATKKQALEAVPGDVPINVKRGSPAPNDGVWMSVPYAQSIVNNMTAWQTERNECVDELKKCPSGAPSNTTIILLIGAGVVAGFAAAKGYDVIKNVVTK